MMVWLGSKASTVAKREEQLGQPLSNTDAVRVVTLRSLRGANGLETGSTKAPAHVIERYGRVLSKLEEETLKTSPNVFIAALQDKDASVMQSRLAEQGDAGPRLASGGLEAQFGEGLTGGDIWGWARSVFDHIDKGGWHAIERPPNEDAGQLADSGRVLPCWGTGARTRTVCGPSAASIEATGTYELLLHVGDIDHSGTEKEAQQRFIAAWPKTAGKMSRALNGNHEMYSGGFGYFDKILPHFEQPSSYFALQNTHWLLVGLDTAYDEHDLDTKQVAWLNAVINRAGDRKVILFSHHQPFSRLDQQGLASQQSLRGLLQKKAITAWYWGHEHDCVIYDKHPHFELLGRCIGHGGIPAPRKSRVKNAAP